MTVRGHSLRPVEISPTSGTQSNDAFVVQGDPAVEDVTIKDFYYNSGSDTGYGFRMANNFRVYLSPSHIRNVTVITKGTTTSQHRSQEVMMLEMLDEEHYLTEVLQMLIPREASMLFAVTFITPGATGLKITNGARCEWLNCFTYFAEKGIHMVDGTAGLKGDGKTRIKYSGLTGSNRAGQTIYFLMLAEHN